MDRPWHGSNMGRVGHCKVHHPGDDGGIAIICNRVRHVLVAAIMKRGMVVKMTVQEIVINVLGVQQDGKSLAVQRVHTEMNWQLQVNIPVGLAKRAPVTITGLCGVIANQ